MKYQLNSGEKAYRVTLMDNGGGDWCCVLAVNEKPGKEVCEQINDFWSSSESRLEQTGGDVVRAALLCVARELIELRSYNVPFLITKMKDREGFPPLDGSCGVRLLECDRWQFEEFECEEIHP